MKILATGSCGLIIGNLVRKLVYEKLPYQIVSIDKVRSNSTSSNSVYWNKNHTFHIADIRDQNIVDTIFQIEKPDVVIHGASEKNSSLNEIISSNVLGTQNLINASVTHKLKRFIYLSSVGVYGSLTSENQTSWIESDRLNPTNSYAASKASGELLLLAAHTSQGLNYNIARLSNNYGPRQTQDKLIPRTIKSILTNDSIYLYGEGNQLREWTHVFDTCSGILKILEGPENEIYNLSSNYEFSNLEIAQRVCNILGKGHNLISYVKSKDHDFKYAMNSNKLKNLGWESQTKFKDGLENTINWFMNNQWMFR